MCMHKEVAYCLCACTKREKKQIVNAQRRSRLLMRVHTEQIVNVKEVADY